ncbi:MAG: FtsX-like permease family protein, partial [Reichenbachiella sp.]
MIPKLAWRNIWRNKTRSMVVIIALMSGLTAAVFISAMMTGMTAKWVEASINQELSEVQVHQKEYLIMEDLTMTLDEKTVQSSIKNNKEVSTFSSRLQCDAMAMTANNNTQVRLLGIDPEIEKTVTTINEKIIEGDYFISKSRTKPIVVSKKLCDKLKIRLKSKIIISLADANNQPQAETFNVVGIYHTGNTLFDETNVFVLKNQLHNIIGIEEGQSHVIAIRTHEEVVLDSLTAFINDQFPKAVARDWRALSPTINMASSMMGTYSYILISVVLIALVFGIINTMLMVILERTKEIGMLRALGMNNNKIGWMILLETVILCLIGVLIGNFISYVLVTWTGQTGISLDQYAEGFESMGIASTIYPSIANEFYLHITIMVVFTALFSSIFPIIRAFKLNPATAIRD